MSPWALCDSLWELGCEFGRDWTPSELWPAGERSRAGAFTRALLPHRLRREAAYPHPCATRAAPHSGLTT